MERSALKLKWQAGAHQVHPLCHGSLHCNLYRPPSLGDQGPGEDPESVSVVRHECCPRWQVLADIEKSPTAKDTWVGLEFSISTFSDLLHAIFWSHCFFPKSVSAAEGMLFCFKPIWCPGCCSLQCRSLGVLEAEPFLGRWKMASWLRGWFC
jgi:hypothetical protein